MPARIAFEVRRTNRKFNKGNEILSQLEKTMKGGVKRDLVGELDKVVADWSNDSTPTWEDKFKRSRDSMVLEIFSGGENGMIFQYVDRGTERHDIYPVNAPMLVFALGYEPKTAYRGRYGIGSGTADGPVVVATHVDHPGNTRREFSGKISVGYRATFKRKMKAAMKRGIN